MLYKIHHIYKKCEKNLAAAGPRRRRLAFCVYLVSLVSPAYFVYLMNLVCLVYLVYPVYIVYIGLGIDLDISR